MQKSRPLCRLPEPNHVLNSLPSVAGTLRGKDAAARASATVPMDRGGIQKHVHVHTLGHCYGAHLVELGLHLRAVQEEMGHACPKTTALQLLPAGPSSL